MEQLDRRDVLHVPLSTEWTHIRLCHAELAAEEWTQAVERLRQLPRLAKLSLIGSSLPADWAAVFENLPELTRLELEAPRSLTIAENLGNLAAAAATHKLTLKDLSLTAIITPELAPLLQKLLASCHALTTLSISNSPGVGADIVKHVVAGLPLSPKLGSLKLDDIGLNVESMQMLMEAVKPSNIRALDLSNNAIDSPSFAALMTAVPETYISTLRLQKCSIAASDSNLRHLQEALFLAINLTRVELDKNPIFVGALSDLPQRLQKNMDAVRQQHQSLDFVDELPKFMLRLYVCGTSGGGKTRLIKSLQRFDRSTRRVVDATFDDEDDPEERHQLQPGAAVEQWLAHQQAHMTIRLTQFSARAEDYLLDIALNNASLEHCAFLIVVRMPTVKWPSLDTVIRAIASAVRFHLNGLANRIKWHRLQRRPPHHCPSTCVVLSHASDVELTPLNIPLGPLHEQLIHLWQQLRAEYEEFVDLLEVPHRLDCRKHKQARAVFRWVRACYNAMPRREGALRRAAVRFFDSWQNSELRNFEKNGARPPPGWPARLFLRDVCVPFTQADRLILRHYAPADVDPAQFGIVATQVLSLAADEGLLFNCWGMDGRQWVVSMAGFWAKVAPVVLRTQAAHGMGSNTDPHLKIKSHMASTWQKLGINPGHALAVLSACGLCCEWPRPGADLIYCPVLASADPPTHVWPVDHCQWKWRCGRALKLVHPPNLKQFMACQLEMNHLQVEHGADFYLWRLGAAWRMGDQWELMMRWWPADMDDVPVESEIDTLGSLGGNLIEVLMRARTVPAAGIAWDAMTEITKFFQRRLGDHTLLGISSRVLRHEVFQPGGRILSHQPLSSIPVDADDDEFGIHRFSLLKPLAIENLGELGFEDLKIDNALLTSKDWVPADYAELVANPVARSFRRHASTASNSNNDVFTDDVDIPGAAASVTLPGPRPHRMSSMDNTQEILYVKTIKTSSVPKFVQHMAEANMFVNEIRACYMEPLKRAFEARVATLQQRQGTRQGTPEWHAASDAEVKHALMAHFNKSAKLVGSSGSSSNNNSSSPSATSSDHAVRIVLAWHGCSVATARDICQQNFRKLRDRDAGFFGAGLYLTLDPIYAGFYAAGLIGGNMAAPGTGKATGSDAAATAGAVALPPPTRTSETVALLLCAVLVSKVYPVTRSDYKNGKTCKYRGKALERDHDTHIVRVSPDLDFEATNTPAEDDPLEIVVDTDANILPLAQVLFTYSQPDVLL